ncbi:MAG: LysM peptidoglycan-binding domain-containing protein [bacterium]|nr:LysM peptidoglycan-binding domain-containing protein [bacterium]
MKYIKPHLSPDLRAQITPHHKRDRTFVSAGVFFLILSLILAINLWPKTNNPSLPNNKLEIATIQSESSLPTDGEKQVLGATTLEEPETQTPVIGTSDTDPGFTSYIVQNGDTLFNISQQYNIKWDLIAEINNLKEPYLLHGGQNLKIPQATTSLVPNKIYTIQSGDTLFSIAREFNITVNDIVAVNPNLQQSDLITVGQVIKLP